MPKFKIAPNTIDGMSEGDFGRFVERETMKARFGPENPTPTNLLRFRLKKRLKKQTVAEMMNVTPRTYYSYENGSRPIPSDALVRLATLTGADLHEILMGRPAAINADVIKAGLIDMEIIERMLIKDNPEIDESTRSKVVRRVVTTDWGELDRMHPSAIRRAIATVTRYSSDPTSQPAPPYYKDYEDRPEDYEQAMLEWQSVVDDNSSEDPDDINEPKCANEHKTMASNE
ncbi:MAG: helix-turn-helix domain-containing protein [Octadecabacter sp.]